MTKQTKAVQSDDVFFPTIDTNVENSQLIINFDDVSEDGFEPLPVGTYDATIGGMELKKSKAGNPMMSITFNVQHEDYKNRKLFTHFVLNNDIALGRLKRFLLNVFPDAELSNLDLNELCAGGTGLGRACTLKVTQRPYDGRMSNDVKEVLPPQDLGIL